MWITIRYRFGLSVSQATVKPAYVTTANNTKRTAENAKRRRWVIIRNYLDWTGRTVRWNYDRIMTIVTFKTKKARKDPLGQQ